MTEVEFHTGVGDCVAFACRLLRKAYRQGLRVMVTAPDEVLGLLDRALWVAYERDFIAHVRIPGSLPAVAARTPIWLAAQAGAEGAPRVLINLGADAPSDLGLVDRLIEVVAADPDEAQRGRSRWRAYKAAGLGIKHHPGAIGHE